MYCTSVYGSLNIAYFGYAHINSTKLHDYQLRTVFKINTLGYVFEPHLDHCLVN